MQRLVLSGSIGGAVGGSIYLDFFLKRAGLVEGDGSRT